MIEFDLDGREFVTLNNLLKLTGLCHSGGFAKAVIADGLVKVDGKQELRKANKIVVGQKVEFDGQIINVVSNISNE